MHVYVTIIKYLYIYITIPALPLKDGQSASLPSEDRMISPKVAQLVEEIANLSLLDVMMR